MKLRKPLLLICLMLLLTQMSYTQQQPTSVAEQNNEYGIEPEKNYPGWMILEILQEAEIEIDIAVEEAYAEGYKAASLRYAPEIEYLKYQLGYVQRKNTLSKIGFGAGGFFLGFLSGFIIHFAF